MRIEQMVCDVCGAVKGVVNHWFIVLEYNDRFLIMSAEDEQKNTHLAYPQVTATECCGEACTMKKVSELLTKREQYVKSAN